MLKRHQVIVIAALAVLGVGAMIILDGGVPSIGGVTVARAQPGPTYYGGMPQGTNAVPLKDVGKTRSEPPGTPGLPPPAPLTTLPIMPIPPEYGLPTVYSLDGTPPASSLPFPTPPYSPSEPHMVSTSVFTPTILHQALLNSAHYFSSLSWAGSIKILTAWVIPADHMTVGTGTFTGDNTAAVVALGPNGQIRVYQVAPGNAYIVGVKDGNVVMLAGTGYVSWSPTTGNYLSATPDGSPLPSGQSYPQ